jgi:DNA-binding MurR/RpiR family transcriptional regulator
MDLDGLLEAEIRAIELLRHSIQPEQLEQAIELLAGAEAIHIIGQQRAFPVASYLSHGFSQLGARARVLSGIGGMLLEQASLVGRRDALVVVSFAPYAPETLAVAHRADERGVPIVLLTDSPLSPLLPLARVALEVEDTAMMQLRAMSASMCLAWAMLTYFSRHQGTP